MRLIPGVANLTNVPLRQRDRERESTIDLRGDDPASTPYARRSNLYADPGRDAIREANLQRRDAQPDAEPFEDRFLHCPREGEELVTARCQTIEISQLRGDAHVTDETPRAWTHALEVRSDRLVRHGRKSGALRVRDRAPKVVTATELGSATRVVLDRDIVPTPRAPERFLQREAGRKPVGAPFCSERPIRAPFGLRQKFFERAAHGSSALDSYRDGGRFAGHVHVSAARHGR